MEKTRECPRCWVAMEKVKIELLGPDIITDVCPQCQGIWFDDNELKKVLGDRKLANYLTKHIGTQSKSKLLCPRCRGLMDLEYAQEVEIDVCLTCHGAWLDAGELALLKQKSDAGYTGDKELKAEERWEEMIAKKRKRALNSLFGRMLR